MVDFYPGTTSNDILFVVSLPATQLQLTAKKVRRSTSRISCIDQVPSRN